MSLSKQKAYVEIIKKLIHLGVAKLIPSTVLLLSCMERNCYLRNCVPQLFRLIFDIFEAREGLEGLKLDEIEAANSFPMLPMARG